MNVFTRVDRLAKVTGVANIGRIAPAALLTLACVASGTYEAEVAQNAALRASLEEREALVGELKREIKDLHSTTGKLELEQQSLSEERLILISDLNKIRTGNAELRAALERERSERERTQTELKEVGGTYERLVNQLENEVSQGQLEIERLQGRLQVRALERILFDSGSVKIKPEGQKVLAKVAAQLKRIDDHEVRVEGHTDSVPIETPRFPSNWELSSTRAATVVRFLIDNGVDPNAISAIGRGEFEPIADNSTPEGRARNRRIEIELVPIDDEV